MTANITAPARQEAAQAAAKILTYLGIAQEVSMEPGTDRRRDHIQSLIDDALPKLRPPVADAEELSLEAQEHGHRRYEQGFAAGWGQCAASAPVASAEVMDALNWVDDFIARCNRDDRGSCESVNILRRALASAPVAGEALTRFCPECGLVGNVASGYRSCCPDGGSARMIPVSLAKKCRDNFLLAINRDAAPQASDAQCSCPSGDGSLRHPCAVHQTSEAVREAIKTFGSKVFKALAAIARANGPETRKEDDPELIYRDPVMEEVVRIRQAYDELSAALSAQPGAQKEQSDAN